MMTFNEWLERHGSKLGVPFIEDFMEDFFNQNPVPTIETWDQLHREVRNGCPEAQRTADRAWRAYERYRRKED